MDDLVNSETASNATINYLKRRPQRLHHHAYTTDDHEGTRQFYENVLGIPLVAMYIEREFLEGEWVELGHAFYGLEDGSALAFFNFADPVKQDKWRAKRQSLFTHISLLVDAETQDAILERLEKYAVGTFTIEHGYCKSIYVQDPNGLQLEFTVDPDIAPTIHAKMASTARQDLARWIAGNRESNNEWRVDEVAAISG